jgi:hypothetical protein
MICGPHGIIWTFLDGIGFALGNPILYLRYFWIGSVNTQQTHFHFHFLYFVEQSDLDTHGSTLCSFGYLPTTQDFGTVIGIATRSVVIFGIYCCRSVAIYRKNFVLWNKQSVTFYRLRRTAENHWNCCRSIAVNQRKNSAHEASGKNKWNCVVENTVVFEFVLLSKMWAIILDFQVHTLMDSFGFMCQSSCGTMEL